MPNLIQSFQGRDIGYLRIVARLWGIELTGSDKSKLLKELVAALLDQAAVSEIVNSLPTDARSALEALIDAEGKLPLATFVRRFGEIRETGPGRRDREQIYKHPISPAEDLIYRGLLARAFFDTPSGAQEYAYIPEEFLNLIPQNTKKPMPILLNSGEPLGRPALQKEREQLFPASDRLLDDATTLLVALRMRLPSLATYIPVNVIGEFLSAAKIIPSPPLWNKREDESQSLFHYTKGLNGKALQSGPIKSFLEMPRAEALTLLAKSWRESKTFNELYQVPGLICESGWSNQPLITREFLLNLLNAIPQDTWWSLPAFILGIKEKYPDFQRPVGDYDSWFIKRASDGFYLRGFSAWDDVDGALIYYMITGPLYWLGLVDLAAPNGKDIVSAFRPSKSIFRKSVDEAITLHVSSQGKIIIPRLFARATRYQIARFCEWDKEQQDEYRYRVTAVSLAKATVQGLKVNQLLGLLVKNSPTGIPPAFVKALKRWELNGTEARLESSIILRVSRPEILEELHKSKAGRFLGEILGPVTVVVKTGAQSKILVALSELGLLAEDLTILNTNANTDN